MEFNTTNPLITIINTLREETISSHYQLALVELKDRVKNEPLTVSFYVYSGCISKDVATEIAHRLSVGDGYTATVCSSMLTSKFYLEVNMPLPEHLIHKIALETKVIDSEPELITETVAV